MKRIAPLALLLASLATNAALNNAAFIFSPHKGENLWTKSLAALRRGNPDETLRHLGPLLRHDPYNHIYLSLQADALRAKGEWALAAEIGELLLESKRPKMACDHLTASYRALGMQAELRGAFERCLALEPDNVNGLFELASLYEEAGDLERAERLYARLAPSPSFAGARAALERVRRARKEKK